MVSSNSTFTYSPVRKVNFATVANDIVVYPNPVTNSTFTITAPVNCNTAQLFDASGKLVQQFVLRGNTNVLTLKGIAKGMYQLKTITENAVYTNKIMVQ